MSIGQGFGSGGERKFVVGQSGYGDMIAPGVVPIELLASASASFARPNDTAAYAAGDLIANTTSAGSVVPFALPLCQVGVLDDIKLTVSGNAGTFSYLALLFASAPSVSVGDNGAMGFPSNNGGSPIAATESNYLGLVRFGFNGPSGIVDPAVTYFADARSAHGQPEASDVRPPPRWSLPAGQKTIYALLVAGSAITPAAGQTFELEVWARPLANV